MSDQKDASTLLLQMAMHSVATAGLVYLTHVCIDEQSKHTEEMKRVRNAFHKIQEYEPDELVDKLENLYKREKSKGKYIDCGKFFVKGVVSCERPIQSFKDHHIKLIYQNIKKYDLVATVKENKVLDHSRQFKSSQTSYAGVFELEPSTGIKGNKNVGKCFVENIRNSRFGNVSHFTASEETSLFPAINFATLGVGSIIKIGFDQNEYGIKVGDKITVYGKVLYDQVNKLIKFESPQNILANKEEYEQYISDFSFAGVGVLVFATLAGLQVYLFGKAVYSLVFESSSKKK